MAEVKTIETLTIPAGKRTYFIDVNITREGSRYLKISENKRLEDGQYERHHLIFFEENIKQLIDGLDKILHHFQGVKIPTEKNRMALTKEKYPNAYKPWGQEEDTFLTKLFCEGKKPTEISLILKRNRGAIASRIAKLELDKKYG